MVWQPISASISSRIPAHLDEDGCPLETQSFPQSMRLLRQLAPLWEHGLHIWSQIICRGPDGRPYFTDERKLQWANPHIKFPLPEALTRALDYLRTLPFSKAPLTGYYFAKNPPNHTHSNTRSPPDGEP